MIDLVEGTARQRKQRTLREEARLKALSRPVKSVINISIDQGILDAISMLVAAGETRSRSTYINDTLSLALGLDGEFVTEHYGLSVSKKSKPTRALVSVRLPEEDVWALDAVADGLGYKNRNQYIAHLVKVALYGE
jgi:hypothetical protein